MLITLFYFDIFFLQGGRKSSFFKQARSYPMFPCHEEKIKWDDYGEFIRCVLTFSTDKSLDISLWLLLQCRVLKVEFPQHHFSKKAILTVNSLCLIALKCENKLYRHSQQIKKVNSYAYRSVKSLL